ncbi:glycine receptor subunit alpha-2 [Octopus bimaculoides]|uniref:glycine receptor subunit alpha-2 n=1 Tax=Octopus bimaculoides TaxID=37653 RepID=UPI0022E4A449|nr:glycine receptor subunit alpha-2 [Octopus bimaculoides]
MLATQYLRNVFLGIVLFTRLFRKVSSYHSISRKSLLYTASLQSVLFTRHLGKSVFSTRRLGKVSSLHDMSGKCLMLTIALYHSSTDVSISDRSYRENNQNESPLAHPHPQNIDGLRLDSWVLSLSAKSLVIQNLTDERLYDNRISPHFDLEIPTEVRVHLYIYSIDSISESAMDYTMTFILTQIWNDPRLDYSSYLEDQFLELNTKFIEKLWVPDLYFANEKHASFHLVTMPNKMIHLYKNVVYTPDNVVFMWQDNNPVAIYGKLEMAQFVIDDIQPENCSTKHEENEFTCIVAFIYLQRRVEFFLLQVFIPSTMIVFISWVSFWLPINAVPARIALGSTTVLIMITQRQSTAISLPPVSYVKAIDVWTVTCLVFVFAALLEYAVVSTYSRHETKRFSIKVIQNNRSLKQTFNVNQAESVENGDIKAECDERTEAQMRSKAKRMDVISRISFPLCFLLFSLGYWSWYLSKTLSFEIPNKNS